MAHWRLNLRCWLTMPNDGSRCLTIANTLSDARHGTVWLVYAAWCLLLGLASSAKCGGHAELLISELLFAIFSEILQIAICCRVFGQILKTSKNVGVRRTVQRKNVANEWFRYHARYTSHYTSHDRNLPAQDARNCTLAFHEHVDWHDLGNGCVLAGSRWTIVDIATVHLSYLARSSICHDSHEYAHKSINVSWLTWVCICHDSHVHVLVMADEWLTCLSIEHVWYIEWSRLSVTVVMSHYAIVICCISTSLSNREKSACQNSRYLSKETPQVVRFVPPKLDVFLFVF